MGRPRARGQPSRGLEGRRQTVLRQSHSHQGGAELRLGISTPGGQGLHLRTQHPRPEREGRAHRRCSINVYGSCDPGVKGSRGILQSPTACWPAGGAWPGPQGHRGPQLLCQQDDSCVMGMVQRREARAEEEAGPELPGRRAWTSRPPGRGAACPAWGIARRRAPELPVGRT